MPAPRRRGRPRFDDELDERDTTDHHRRHHHRPASGAAVLPPPPDDPSPEAEDAQDPPWSTYRDATQGPRPVPPWVVTDPRALDLDHGVLKTGKEADVSLVERRSPDGHACLLAAKRYRPPEHRMFHRDAGYLEGRRVRSSREMRAMATRTDFGRELLAGRWAAAEFEVLARLWRAGAAVPYPVQLLGTELMMEFVGSPDGVAAPRLAQLRPAPDEAAELYAQMIAVLRQLADAGYAHGDLSPYNVLVHEGRLVLIDLPQAVDLVGNPSGFGYLRRDCANICRWFAMHHVADADAERLSTELLRSVPGIS